jgi:hypothetical protein
MLSGILLREPRQMQIDNRQQAYTSRGMRESGHTGLGRRFALEGDARPGDVLVLAGGALVRDLNANGLVDGPDEQLDDGAPALLGGLVDVRG